MEGVGEKIQIKSHPKRVGRGSGWVEYLDDYAGLYIYIYIYEFGKPRKVHVKPLGKQYIQFTKGSCWNTGGSDDSTLGPLSKVTLIVMENGYI